MHQPQCQTPQCTNLTSFKLLILVILFVFHPLYSWLPILTKDISKEFLCKKENGNI